MFKRSELITTRPETAKRTQKETYVQLSKISAVPLFIDLILESDVRRVEFVVTKFVMAVRGKK